MTRRAFLAGTAAWAAGAALGGVALAQPSEKLDLLIKGGTVIDPASGIQARADLGVRAGRIAALDPDIPAARAARLVEANGKLVTPGLIDLHAQCYAQNPAAGLPADELVSRTAVTTWVSAGEASARDFAAFRRFAARHTRCRIYAFVHVAKTGADADPTALARLLAQNRDMILGVTVQPATRPSGEDDLAALDRAIAVVERAQTRGRVMCNVAGVRQNFAALLDRLRPGDILTHAYSAARDGLVDSGKIAPAALAARQRGVIIDVGHGTAHFDHTVAEAAIEQGWLPDVISSGIQASNGAAGAAPHLTAVMSTFLNAGLSLEQVIALATSNPARLIGRDAKLGTLDLGAPADIAILELVESPIDLADTRGMVRRGSRWLRPVQAIRAGTALRPAAGALAS